MGIRQLPKRSGEYLFEIILRRHEVKSTLMTSNRPLDDWGKLLGDVPRATAIHDRFLHHAEVIQISGKSYRLANRENGAKRCQGAHDRVSFQAQNDERLATSQNRPTRRL